MVIDFLKRKDILTVEEGFVNYEPYHYYSDFIYSGNIFSTVLSRQYGEFEIIMYPSLTA